MLRRVRSSPRASLPGDETAAAGRPELPHTGVDDDGTAEGAGIAAPTARRFPRTRAELLAAAEVLGLTGLAFARPVLDSFGRAPEAFLARDAAPLDLVLFAFAVTLVPPALVAGATAATRLLGRRARAAAHLLAVGVLAAVAIRRFGTDATALGSSVLVGLAVVGAAAVVLLRLRVAATATYLRLLGAASVVFVVQFLVLSPTSSLGGRDTATTSGDVSAAVEAATGGDPPPIVVVVVDALPTVSLLDGEGRIDPELYPNIAALAGDATWYRNNSTVSAFTFRAVPAMLTGQLPRDGLPDAGTYPDNLFTLFAGTHHVEAVEQITRLCPTDVCPTDGGRALPALLGDAAEWWRGGIERDVASGARLIPEVLEPDRGEDFVRWIDEQDFRQRSGAPGLWFHHVVLPHEPWSLLDDRSSYEVARDEPFGLFIGTHWSVTGVDVARQRQVLQSQAVDAMLGRLFDRLRAAGTYDETLIVLAGDHGQAFEPGEPMRGVSADTYDEVAWTPLIVKAPGQRAAEIDDTNVWNVDLLPTIADVLGLELPWDADGVPASSSSRASGDKQITDNEINTLEPAPGSDMVPLDGDAGFATVLGGDFVPATGPDAVWRRTEHGGLVGRPLSDLAVGGEAAGRIEVERLDRIEDQGDADPLIEVVGHTALDEDQVVAFAINGVVAAVAPASSSSETEFTLVHALLRPDTFDASNELTAYLVDGAVDDERLHPLRVAGG